MQSKAPGFWYTGVYVTIGKKSIIGPGAASAAVTAPSHRFGLLAQLGAGPFARVTRRRLRGSAPVRADGNFRQSYVEFLLSDAW